MDISFDIHNKKGDQIRVALSYYETDVMKVFTSNPSVLTLTFYDVSLWRVDGEGYVGYKALWAITNTLAKFMKENDDAVLCFYCDPTSDIKRSHTTLSPQEYRSHLFSRMFDLYAKSHVEFGFVNHTIKIEDPNNPYNSQFAHFICRKHHEPTVLEIGKLIMEK